MTKLFFCGDIYISNSVKFINESLSKQIKIHDYVIGNLEAPITTNTSIAPKAGPSLKQNSNIVTSLKNEGFTHVTLANNHIFDYGVKGLDDTIEVLNKNNISYCGASTKRQEVYSPMVINSNEGTIAIFSFSEAEFGVLLEDESNCGYGYINASHVNDLIKDAKINYDITIICAHVGVENIDLPIPIWKKRFKELCDVGVDAIIAHHPHVPQGFEIYKGKPIYYSLGNFFMEYGKVLDKEDWSYSVSLNIKSGKIHTYNCIPHIRRKSKLFYYQEGLKKIDILNNKLTDNYNSEVKRIILKLYDDLYQHDVKRSVLGYSTNSSIFKRIKRIIAMRILKRKNRFNNAMIQYHLFLKDSHRYMITEGIRLKFFKETN